MKTDLTRLGAFSGGGGDSPEAAVSALPPVGVVLTGGFGDALEREVSRAASRSLLACSSYTSCTFKMCSASSGGILNSRPSSGRTVFTLSSQGKEWRVCERRVEQSGVP